MFIITILQIDVLDNQIFGVYEDEMLARDQLVKIAIEHSKTDDKFKSFEAVHINLSEIRIYKKLSGYLSSSKELFKIITLHELT